MGRYEEALVHIERAITIVERGLGAAHPDLAIQLNNHGEILNALHRYAEARKVFERGLRVEAAFGDFQRLAPNIASHDMDIPAAAVHVDHFTDRHRDRIRLFAGGAASAPDADGAPMVARMVRLQVRQNHFG